MQPRPPAAAAVPTAAPPTALARVPALLPAALLGAATAVHLAAQLTGADRLVDVTQWFLMPLLAATLWLAAGALRSTRLVRLAVVALGLSWLGDVAPDLVPEDLSFLAMLGFFLLAHVAYVAAFRPLWADGVLGRRRTLVLPYAAALVALVAACAPGADELLVPVVVYGTVLTAVAVLATFDRVAAVGGVLFIVSDSLIALNAFVDGYALPGHGFWVMLTYVAAQALLAAGVLRTARADAGARVA